ncbi:hypothetical protein CLOM621_06255 [Clostridium sp. M62/1]|nr:hypothetical protein CLOM621_06255 [Clostridium sp. M62/1]
MRCILPALSRRHPSFLRRKGQELFKFTMFFKKIKIRASLFFILWYNE